MEGLPEGTWSAETYGNLLAAELERAVVEEVPLLAPCFDESKAYDIQRLDLLEHLYSRSGLPAEVWKPMLDMAKAPRRIKVMQAVGPWWLPSSGMLPGCPGATFVQSFLLERWRRFTSAAAPSTQVRCWVDDSTAQASGATEGLATLVAATRSMEDLEQGDGVRVNRKKTGVLVTCAALRDLVQQAAAVKSRAAGGLVAGFGPVEPAGWQEAWRQHLQVPEGTCMEWHGEGRLHEEDLRAVAASTSVWLAFDGLPPPAGEELVLRANRGLWVDARLPQCGGAGVPPAVDQDQLRQPLAPEHPPARQEFGATVSEARVRVWADGHPLRWSKGPPLAVPVVAALKDLGVAQGGGREGKEMQAKRSKEAFKRLEWIARAGVSRAKRARLVAGSALAAGMYGTAAHVHDHDLLPSLRRWVMHALYRGSRFASIELFMHLVLPFRGADPWRVALKKGWEACSRARSLWGEQCFQAVWLGSKGDGPLRSFRKLLEQLPAAGGGSLAESYLAGGSGWERKHGALVSLDEALQRRDLAKASVRQGLKEVVNVDVPTVRAIAGRMPGQGLREAYESVLVGDMVVRGTTKHWQEHDGTCKCGREEETVEHVFWRCPRYAAERLGPSRCDDALARHLGSCQRRLGAPAREAALEAWKAWKVWAPPAWRAAEVYVDASGRHPKDPAIRVVGWALCAKVAGAWQAATGWLRPGATVTAGEATATIHAVEVLEPGGRVVTDCKAVHDRWYSIRGGRWSAADLSDRCWVRLAAALRARPDVQCHWMPSHRSGAEAERLGIPEAWHKGNGEADERAKQIARERDVPAVLLASHAQNLETAERVARTVAAIQLKRLQGRRQLACGAAVKERVRRLPGLPWRLRAKGVKRRKPGAGAAAEQQEGFSAGDLLQVKPGNWPALEAVLDLVQNDPCTVPEVHDLRPVGPWPLAGTCESRNGRLGGLWVCNRCPKQASDSSRVVAAVMTRCGPTPWLGTSGPHEVQEDAGAWSCKRCRLSVLPQHRSSAAQATCPVPRLSKDGQPWPEGEASVRAVLGRVKGWRKWCLPADQPQPPPEVEAAPAAALPAAAAAAAAEALPGAFAGSDDEPPVPAAKRARASSCLEPYVGHWAFRIGRGLRCLRCFSRPVGDYRAWKRGRCFEELPPLAMPGGMPTEVLRSGGLGANASEPAKARFTELHIFAARTAGRRPGLGMI